MPTTSRASVVELALKACIAKRFRPETIPDKSFSKVFTHDPKELLKIAGLEGLLKQAAAANAALADNWAQTTNWSEQCRYVTWDEVQARAMVESVADVPDGVLEWLKQHW